MSSPIVCAGDILVTLYYWTRYGFTDLRFRGASRLLIADMHIAKAELVFGQKDLLQHTIWTPAVLSVLANLMMAVPQLKIVALPVCHGSVTRLLHHLCWLQSSGCLSVGQLLVLCQSRGSILSRTFTIMGRSRRVRESLTRFSDTASSSKCPSGSPCAYQTTRSW
jgi:hypothetical protein